MWLNVGFYATCGFGFAIAIFNVRGTVDNATLLKVKGDGVTPDDTDLFFIDIGQGTEGYSHIGGVTFQALQLQYRSGSAVQQGSTAAAIHADRGQKEKRYRVGKRIQNEAGALEVPFSLTVRKLVLKGNLWGWASLPSRWLYRFCEPAALTRVR